MASTSSQSPLADSIVPSADVFEASAAKPGALILVSSPPKGKRKASGPLNDSETITEGDSIETSPPKAQKPRKRPYVRKKKQSIDTVDYKQELEQLRQHVDIAAERCYETGQKWIAQGHSDVALAYFCAAANFKTSDLRYLAALCEIHYQRGHPETALSYALGAKANPEIVMTTDFLACIVRFHSALGQFAAALSIFSDIIAIDPHNAGAKQSFAATQNIIQLEQTAKGCLARTDWRSLITCIDRLEAAYPDSTPQWQKWRADAQTSLASLAQSTFTVPGVPHFDRGEQLLMADQIDAACECYRAQLQTHSNHQPSRLRMLTIELIKKADECIGKEQHPQAIAHLSQAISLDTRSPAMHSILLKRGLALFENGKPSHALGDCMTAIKLNQKSYRGYHLRGLCQVALGDLKDSVACLEQALHLYDEVMPTNERMDWRDIVSRHLETAKNQLAANAGPPLPALAAIEASPCDVKVTLTAPIDYKNQSASLDLAADDAHE